MNKTAIAIVNKLTTGEPELDPGYVNIKREKAVDWLACLMISIVFSAN